MQERENWKGIQSLSDYMTMYVEKPPKDLTSKLWWGNRKLLQNFQSYGL